MTKKIIIILASFLICTQTFAVKRWGNISANFKYNNLKISQISANRCKLSIEIENKSKKAVSEYKLEILALDIHKSVEWRTNITIDSIEKGESQLIGELITKCSEDNPYKLIFKEK